MSTLMQDIKFAVRTLKKRWMITALAVFSLALAIGGNATVFSMVDAFLFRPLPYPEPERVVLVGERQKDQPEFSGGVTTSLQTARDWTERGRSVETWALMQPRTMSLRGPDRAEPVVTIATTPSFFGVLEGSPVRGRLFADTEAVEGAGGVVLLSHEYWVANYGEESDPLGEVLTLNGEPHEVIGVMAPEFGFLVPAPDMWVPLSESANASTRDTRGVIALGRMRPDATTEQVRAEMVQLQQSLEDEFPDELRGWTADTYNLRYDLPTQQTRILFGMLQGSVILVLIIACVNIINLLLARGQDRSREIALRTALGAGRGRIVRQLLTESSLMVAAGTAIGVGMAAFGIKAIATQFAGTLPASYEVVMDGRVLVFTAAVAVFAGILFGLMPALQTFKQGHSQTLKDGGGRGGSGRSRKLLTRTLVVGEIALSFVALGGGSLLVRSFMQIQSADPGFEAGPILTSAIRVPASKYPEDADRALFNTELLDRASRVSGAEGAALASVLPQSPFATTDSFTVDGAVTDPNVAAPKAVVVQTSPSYLDVMDIALVRGRFFTDQDDLDNAPVVAVNRSLAEARFPNGALGQRLTVRGESREIVGVVEDVRQVMIQVGSTGGGESIYLPTGQAPRGAGFLVVRARSNPKELAEPLRGALQSLDQDLTLSQILTMDEYVEQFLVGMQVFNVVLGGFGLVALLLASLGTYGVLAYSVSRRSHEIGIRMAMGAESKSVVRMIAKQGIWLGIIGLSIGALLTFPLIGLLNNLLQGLSTVQPSTLFVIAAVLFAVTVAASLVPAGRAATVDPIRTLRNE